VKRLLAFVVAAAMVAGSLYVRSRIDDDGTDRTAPAPSALRIVCSTELAAACDGLGGSTGVEDAGVTADRLVHEDDPAIDAWIVPDPWPALVDVRRRVQQKDQLFGDAVTVATTKLALVEWSGAIPCSGPLTWACAAAAASTASKPGHGDPRVDGIALVALGRLATALLGNEEPSSTDLDDPAFDQAFTAFERAVPMLEDDPLARMLAQGRSAYDFVVESEAAATATLATAARKDEVRLLYPAPVGTVGAVVAARHGVRVDVSLTDRATRTLAAVGWTRGGRATGIPDAGFLDALLARWHEVVG
jgi:hypothetical protein